MVGPTSWASVERAVSPISVNPVVVDSTPIFGTLSLSTQGGNFHMGTTYRDTTSCDTTLQRRSGNSFVHQKSEKFTSKRSVKDVFPESSAILESGNLDKEKRWFLEKLKPSSKIIRFMNQLIGCDFDIPASFWIILT